MGLLTSETWEHIVLNKHVLVAISCGCVINAVFVLLCIISGPIGVLIFLFILILCCGLFLISLALGGLCGLRFGYMLRQKERSVKTDRRIAVEVESQTRTPPSSPQQALQSPSTVQPTVPHLSVYTQTRTIDADSLVVRVREPLAGRETAVNTDVNEVEDWLNVERQTIENRVEGERGDDV